MEPGMIEYLLPGESMNVASPSGINTNSRDFVQTNYRIASAGQGLSYESTSRDVSQVSYSSARHSALEDRGLYQPVQQWLINHFCRRVYKQVITSAVMCGRLKIPDFFTRQNYYLKHKWLPPGWDWVDPLKDVMASKTGIRPGAYNLGAALRRARQRLQRCYRPAGQGAGASQRTLGSILTLRPASSVCK